MSNPEVTDTGDASDFAQLSEIDELISNCLKAGSDLVKEAKTLPNERKTVMDGHLSTLFNNLKSVRKITRGE